MSQTITAVAGLWPLALVVVLAIGMLIFRRQLGALLERLSKVSMKRGQTEVSIESRAQEGIVVVERAPATVEPPKVEEAPKEFASAASEENIFGAMVDALVDRRFDDAQKTFEAMQTAEKDPKARAKNEVLYRTFAYTQGKPDTSLQPVEDIANAHADLRAFALGWLAWAYWKVSAFEQARDAVSRAIEASTNDDERAEHRVTLARMYLQTGDQDDAASLVMGAFGTIVSRDTRAKLYRAASEVFKERGDKLMRAITLEKALELNPSDRELRFSAAYAEGEAELAHLASANYEALIDQDPKASAVAMNNLGVQADAFKLPIKSVALYRASVKEGETLATSNLAYKLLNQGFIEDARARLNEATVRPDVHRNVNEALAEAVKRETAEDESWKGILKQGAIHRLFIHEFAEARFSPFSGAPPFDGSWKAPDGSKSQIEETNGGELAVVWGQEASTLIGLAGAPRRKLEGQRTNRAFVGALKKWNPSFFSGVEGYFDTTGQTALAYVSPDGGRIEVLALDETDPTIMRFTRSTQTALPPAVSE